MKGISATHMKTKFASISHAFSWKGGVQCDLRAKDLAAGIHKGSMARVVPCSVQASFVATGRCRRPKHRWSQTLRLQQQVCHPLLQQEHALVQQ